MAIIGGPTPHRNPWGNIGQSFAQSFAGNFQKASEEKEQETKRIAALKQENAEVEKATGIKLGSIDPKLRQLELAQKLKQKADLEEKQAKQDRINQLTGKGKPSQNKLVYPKNTLETIEEYQARIAGEEPQEQHESSRYTPEQLEELYTIDPDFAKFVQKGQEIEGKQQTKREDVLRKDREPYLIDLANRATSARRAMEDRVEQERLIDTGKLDDPMFAAIMEAMPFNLGKQFLSPETVEYKSALVRGYGELKNIFTGTTRVKEIEIMEGKIADIYLTNQQKKSIIKSMNKASQADMIREEIAAKLESEGKPLSRLVFQREVEKRAKPQLDALFNKIIDEQQAVIKDAQNTKKIKLSIDNPEDLEIIDQFLAESDNWEEAMEKAKKKGYSW